jgi:SpoVK/Ycf46/Vps4 family AAA+-type ATPase
MQYLTEILNLVEAAVSGNRQKGASYAQLLADKLDSAGEGKAATRLRRALSSNPVAGVTAARAVTVQERLPVDSESRLSLADETFPVEKDVQVFLDSHVEASVNEFVTYVQAADKLVEEGIGISPSLLMYGAPGCGKTELAKYIAAKLGLPLVTARVDTLISSFLGSTSKNLRLLFDHVNARPCVLFLDEFDALAKLRDDRQELGELKRVVVSLLQNIDSIQGKRVLLAATNHEHLLDPAIWRRFSYRLHIDLPKVEARRKMFEKFLAHPMSPKALDRFAKASEKLTGSDIRDICESARRTAVIEHLPEVPEADVLRRLLIRTLDAEGLPVPQLIAKAKEHMPDVFTHRILAAAFHMTPGNVTHILNRLHKEIVHE